MEPVVEKLGTVNSDIPPPSFTVILIITFVFQHFLTSALRRNPYIIELIPLEFLVQLSTLKRRRRLRYLNMNKS